jgi:hypothetical protein
VNRWKPPVKVAIVSNCIDLLESRTTTWRSRRRADRLFSAGGRARLHGVHVAKLAWIPEAVISRASEVIREIESETVIDPLAGSKKGRKSSKYTQLIFFDQPVGEPDLREKEMQAHSDPVAEAILRLDLDSLHARRITSWGNIRRGRGKERAMLKIRLIDEDAINKIASIQDSYIR